MNVDLGIAFLIVVIGVSVHVLIRRGTVGNVMRAVAIVMIIILSLETWPSAPLLKIIYFVSVIGLAALVALAPKPSAHAAQ